MTLQTKVYESFLAKPYSPVLGAEIYGIDLTKPLTEQQYADVHDAFLTYQVLFFKEQQLLHPAAQIAFGKHFGELYVHPAKVPGIADYPEIIRIYADENSTVANGDVWHTDVTFEETPPKITMLQMQLIPDTGGDTCFSNTYAAYDNLSDPIKKLCDGLTQRVSMNGYFNNRYKERGVDNKDIEETAPVDHPVIRTHPETGRKAIFVNRPFTECINGLSKDESKSILNILFNACERPQNQIRYRWSINDIAMWDNRCLMHIAMFDYFPHRRSGHRITVIGDKPF